MKRLLILAFTAAFLFVGAGQSFGAFTSANLKYVGGFDNREVGGQVFSYSGSSDTLTTIRAADYFLTIWKQLDPDDIIMVSHASGFAILRVTAATSTTVTVASGPSGLPEIQSLSGPGAINITSETTEVTSTGADALTLVDGAYIGQRKTIILIVDGGTATLTPSNGLGYTTIAFADAGDSVILEWRSGGWAMVGHGGLAGGPVAA